MNYFGNEKEISIKELIYYLSLKWKKIVLYVVTAMLITLGINSYNAYKYMDILGRKIVCYALIKYMVIVAIVVGFLYVMLSVAVYIFSDTIKSVDEFVRLSKIKVIVNVCLNEDSINTRNKLVRKILGINAKRINIQDSLKYISKIIMNDVHIEENNETNIVVVSTLEHEGAEKFVSELSGIVSQNVKVLYIGDYQNEQGVIEKICSADCVILMEYQYSSRYSEIERMCTMMDGLKKDILGVVLVEQN